MSNLDNRDKSHLKQNALNRRTGAQAVATQFISTFKEFPPRQKSQSFNLDQIMEQLKQPAGD